MNHNHRDEAPQKQVGLSVEVEVDHEQTASSCVDMEVSQEEEDLVPLEHHVSSEVKDRDQRVVAPDVLLPLHEPEQVFRYLEF